MAKDIESIYQQQLQGMPKEEVDVWSKKFMQKAAATHAGLQRKIRIAPLTLNGVSGHPVAAETSSQIPSASPASVLTSISVGSEQRSIKRKAADTTTPSRRFHGSVTTPVSIQPIGLQGQGLVPAAGSVGLQRRESSSRPIKRPKRDLPDDEAQHLRRGPISEQMKYCQNIARELLSKKHEVFAIDVQREKRLQQLFYFMNLLCTN